MKKFLTVIIFGLPAFGQAAYTGLGLHSGSATYIASDSSGCAAPNFCAYTGVDVIPWGTVPDFGGSLNNNATAYDTSYLGHLNIDGATTFSNSAFLSPITRLTDSSSVPGKVNASLTAGQGGSGVFTLTNTNTTLVGVNDNSQEHVCLFNTPGYPSHCLPAAAFTGTSKPASGIFITTNMCISGCGTSSSSGTAQDFGAISFSLTDPEVLYTFGNNSYDIPSATTVTPYTINTTTGMYSVGAPVADFQYGLPLGSANAPAWQVSHNYVYGSYVTHALTTNEMATGGVWTSGASYNPGDIIVSQGGTIACMYRATGGGIAAGSPPAFINSPPCKNDALTDSGGVKWRGTNSTAQFVYQNTGLAGTSRASSFQWVSSPTPLAADGTMVSGSAVLTSASNPFAAAMVGQAISVPGAGKADGSLPLYTTILSYQNAGQVTLATGTVQTGGTSGATVALTGHPDFLSSTVGDANGIVWTNVGPSYVPANGNQSWQALGGISDDTAYGGNPSQYGIAISTNTYGVGGFYNKYNASQGSGVWLLEYDHVFNVYHLLNSATGIWTDWLCGGGSGYNCSGGVWMPTTVGTLTAISNPFGTGQACPFYLHNEKISTNGLFAMITSQAVAYPACTSLSNFLVWETTRSSFDSANSLQLTYAGLGHWAIGKNKIVSHTGSAFGYTAGVFATVYDASHASVQPNFSVALKQLASQSSSQTNPEGCYVTAGTTEKNPDCNGAEFIDTHLSWVGDPGTDTWPACGSSYNYATLSPVPFNAWQNMEICYSSYPTYAAGTLPVTQGSVWQFTHTFATGTSVAFSTQFQISEYSQDANWLFWSSDWNCQNGSTSGSAPTVYSGSGSFWQMLATNPVPVNPTSLCGLPWLPQTSYVAGNTVNPIEGTGGNGQVDDVFQALTTGTSGAPSTLTGGQPQCGTVSCFASSVAPTITPVPITAASENGPTVTITSALNPGVNVQVNIAGVTPPGYNGTFFVTSSSSTQFQYSTTSGLGSGTVLGTAAAAGSRVCDSGGSMNPLPPYSTSCTGGVVWQDLGPQTQRGDVFAVNLGIQH